MSKLSLVIIAFNISLILFGYINIFFTIALFFYFTFMLFYSIKKNKKDNDFISKLIPSNIYVMKRKYFWEGDILSAFILIAFLISEVIIQRNDFGIRNNINLITINIFILSVFFILSFLIEYYQRVKKDLYKILIIDDKFIFSESKVKTFFISKVERIILTINEKQLWIEAKNSKLNFELKKLKSEDKRELLLKIKSIAESKKININNNLQQFA